MYHLLTMMKTDAEDSYKQVKPLAILLDDIIGQFVIDDDGLEEEDDQ